MNLYNATPHEVVIRTADGDLRVPASGTLVRIDMIEEAAPPTEGIPSIRRKEGPVVVTGPAIPSGVTVIVPSMALGAAHAAGLHVCAPDTGPSAIREGGQVRAVTRLVRP